MMVRSSRHHYRHPHLCRHGAASQAAPLISYDIVIGEYSEFTIRLPRSS
jgi:hypothetical protein